MVTYKRILDKAAAWEYMREGLLYRSWRSDGSGLKLRRHPEDGWDMCQWARAGFDGLDSCYNFIIVED